MEEITCPWYGFEETDSWKLYSYYVADYVCPECGKSFAVERNCYVTYTSYRELKDMPKGCTGANESTHRRDFQHKYNDLGIPETCLTHKGHIVTTTKGRYYANNDDFASICRLRSRLGLHSRNSRRLARPDK